jgi:hypothetical protein
MTDFLNRFGASAAGTGTVDFENTLDFGPIDDKSVVGTHRTGEAPEETIVVNSTVTSGVSDIVITSTPSLEGTPVWTEIERVKASEIVLGDFLWIPFPKTHQRYVKLQAVATGTLAAGALTARVEPGASAPRG